MIEKIATVLEKSLAAGEIPDGLLQQLSQPADDEDASRLSEIEVIANGVLLITAAIDTTAGLIGNAAHLLFENPEWIDRFREDPRLGPAIIEETLRLESPALSCSRRAGCDFTIGGVEIPEGAQLLLGLAAANRDPDRYPNPDVFDPTRDHQGLLSFGGGQHHCLGTALARLEGLRSIERLFLDSKYNFKPDGIPGNEPAWQRSNPTVRALSHLPVHLSPRAA